MANLYLGRSDYIMKRLALLRNMEAPTISDAKQNFGADLIDKVFCNCDLYFKEDFGLEPPLEGAAGKELWSSPSDLIMGKVCLKPPYTNKYTKALTHQGILDIGLKIEKLFWNQAEIEKAQELEEQERTMRLLCETSKKEAIAEVQKRMMEIFRRQRLELIDEMEDLCKKELWKMEVKFYRDLQDELKEQARYLELMYQTKVEEEVAKTSESVSLESDNTFEIIIQNLVMEFHEILQQEQQKSNFELEAEKVEHKRVLDSLRHELECKNVSNTMYAVIMERKRTERERKEMRKKMTREIHDLETLLQSKQEELSIVVAARDKHKKEVEVREQALLEIIREFQKFINFTLKAVPKQAEYLLCAEKLMVFELTEALTKMEVPPKDDDHDRNYLYDQTPSKSEYTGESLVVKDGHECLKESEISESELSVDAFFPGFYFRDQLFVREDFRDLVAHGVRISPDSFQSTRHVQDILRDLILRIGDDDDDVKRDLASEKKSSNVDFSHQLSSVHFSLKEKPKFLDKPQALEKIDERKKMERRSSIKPILPEEVMRSVNFVRVGTEENKKTLIAATNSLELIKPDIPRISSSIKSGESETQVVGVIQEREYEFVEVSGLESDEVMPMTDSKLILETRDSVIKYKIEKGLTSLQKVEEVNIVEKVVQRPRKPSNLVKALDSLEVLRRRSSAKSDKAATDEYPEAVVLKRMSSAEKEVFQETIHDLGTEKIASAEDHRKALLAFGKFIVHSIEGLREKAPPKKKKVTKVPKKQLKIPDKKIKKVVHEQKKPPPEVREEDKVEPKTNVIVGDSKMNFVEQTDEQFSTDRVKSIVNIIKEHPNLIRLFTSVCR